MRPRKWEEKYLFNVFIILDDDCKTLNKNVNPFPECSLFCILLNWFTISKIVRLHITIKSFKLTFLIILEVHFIN